MALQAQGLGAWPWIDPVSVCRDKETGGPCPEAADVSILHCVKASATASTERVGGLWAFGRGGRVSSHSGAFRVEHGGPRREWTRAVHVCLRPRWRMATERRRRRTLRRANWRANWGWPSEGRLTAVGRLGRREGRGGAGENLALFGGAEERKVFEGESTSDVGRDDWSEGTEGDASTAAVPTNLSVLVVEDDPTCAKLCERMMQIVGYKVTVCGNGKAALELLRGREASKEGSFDLVLTDVHMPHNDGFKVLELAGLEMDLPVVMMSVDGDVPVVRRGVEHGAVDYLIKPIRIEGLKNLWQHVVRRRRLNSREDSGSDQKGALRVDANGPGGTRDNTTVGGVSRKRTGSAEVAGTDQGSVKKARVVWTVDLHKKFVDSVNQLGIEKAVPTTILELMGVSNITRENVASHLQKYRLYIKRLSSVQNAAPRPVVPLQGYGMFGMAPGAHCPPHRAVGMPGVNPAKVHHYGQAFGGDGAGPWRMQATLGSPAYLLDVAPHPAAPFHVGASHGVGDYHAVYPQGMHPTRDSSREFQGRPKSAEPSVAWPGAAFAASGQPLLEPQGNATTVRSLSLSAVPARNGPPSPPDLYAQRGLVSQDPGLGAEPYGGDGGDYEGDEDLLQLFLKT